VCFQCSLKEFYGKLDINDFEWETSGRCPAEPDQVVGRDPADLSRRERGSPPTVIVSTFNLTHTSYWRDDAEPLVRQLVCPGAAVVSSDMFFHNEFLRGLVQPRNGHVVLPCVSRGNEEQQAPGSSWLEPGRKKLPSVSCNGRRHVIGASAHSGWHSRNGSRGRGFTAGRSAVRLTGRRCLPTSLELIQPLVHVCPSRSISAFTAASYGRLSARRFSPRVASRCGRSSPAITSADDIDTEPNLEEFLAGTYERGTVIPRDILQRIRRNGRLGPHRPTQDRKTPHRTMIALRPRTARAGRRAPTRTGSWCACEVKGGRCTG